MNPNLQRRLSFAMSGADGEHILLRKIRSTRQQVNTILDELELEVKQYIDNQQPTGPVSLSSRKHIEKVMKNDLRFRDNNSSH